MPPVTPRRRRARPVADAPIDALLLRSEDLAKGWLLALVEQARLDDAQGILAAELARDGPRICDAALRALASDTDLRRLEVGGALRPLAARVGELAGATAPAGVSRAVDALRAILWTAVRDELRSPEPDLVAELTERLALVGELLREAALEATGAVDMPEAVMPGQVGPGSVIPGSVIPGPVASAAASPPPRPAPSPRPVDRPRAWLYDVGAAPAPSDRPLWVEALEDEIRLSAGGSLSLLLAELEDAQRMSAARPPAETGEAFNRFTAAVRRAVRRQDILVCESEARAWIIARGTGRSGAYALGERIVAAVGASEEWRGVPLAASVGVAVLGEDGRTSAELLEAAEEGRYAAAARGVPILHGEPDDPEESAGDRPAGG